MERRGCSPAESQGLVPRGEVNVVGCSVCPDVQKDMVMWWGNLGVAAVGDLRDDAVGRGRGRGREREGDRQTELTPKEKEPVKETEKRNTDMERAEQGTALLSPVVRGNKKER